MSQDKYANYTPIFKLHPKSESRIECRHAGFCEDVSKLTDDVVCDDIKIDSVGKYMFAGKFCECNITGNYLVQNKKFPVFYASILYSKMFVTGCMFNITLYFTISDESAKKLDNPKKYVGAIIDGTYTIEISVPQTDDFLDKITPFVKDSIFLKHVNEFGNASEEKQRILMETITAELNAKLTEYSQFLSDKPLTKSPYKKSVHRIMNELCHTPTFRELLSHGLSLREKERIEERCPDLSFEPPTNVISLRELGENPDKEIVLSSACKTRSQ